jgi:hypothetical protein
MDTIKIVCYAEKGIRIWCGIKSPFKKTIYLYRFMDGGIEYNGRIV